MIDLFLKTNKSVVAPEKNILLISQIYLKFNLEPMLYLSLAIPIRTF